MGGEQNGLLNIVSIPKGRQDASYRLSLVISIQAVHADGGNLLGEWKKCWPTWLKEHINHFRLYLDGGATYTDIGLESLRDFSAKQTHFSDKQAIFWDTSQTLWSIVFAGCVDSIPVAAGQQASNAAQQLTFKLRESAYFAKTMRYLTADIGASVAAGFGAFVMDKDRSAPPPPFAYTVPSLEHYIPNDFDGKSSEKHQQPHSVKAQFSALYTRDVKRATRLSRDIRTGNEDGTSVLASLLNLTANKDGKLVLTSLLNQDDSAAKSLAARIADFAALSTSGAPIRGSSGKNLPPQLDVGAFTHRLSAVNAHPALRKPLSLVFDLILPSSIKGLNNARSIALVPVFDAGVQDDIVYWHYTAVDTNSFTPSAHRIDGVPVHTDPHNGLLTGSDQATCDVLSIITTDGTDLAAEFVQLAQRIQAADPKYSPGISEKQNPAPQAHVTDGLLLCLADADKFYAAKQERKKLLASGDSLSSIDKPKQTNSELFLYLDDLVQGFRIDVYDEKIKKWYSTSKRKTRFPRIEDELKKLDFHEEWNTDKRRMEGYIQLHAEIKQNKAGVDCHVAEELARWNGWSLSAPFPGLDKKELETTLPCGADQLLAEHKPTAESLCRLRLGRKYAMAVRSVLVDGDSLFPFDKDYPNRVQGSKTETICYRRWEPIKAPVMLLDGRFNAKELPAESAEAIVVKSYRRTGRTKTGSKARILVPPRISLMEAIAHGAFDDNRIPAESGAFTQFELDESGNFPHADQSNKTDRILRYAMPGGQHGYPYFPDPQARFALLELGYENMSRPNCELRDSELPERKFERAKGEHTVIMPSFYRKEGATWPSDTPVPIRLSLIPVGPSEELRFIDKGRHLLSGFRQIDVAVPRGVRAQLRMRCLPENEEGKLASPMELFELSTTFCDRLKADKSSSCFELATKLFNLSSFITPAAQATLTHAVDQPDVAPTLEVVSSPPDMQSTRVMLKITPQIHAASIDRVELYARWEEPYDDDRVGAPLPQTKHSQVVANWTFDSYPAINRDPIPRVAHELGDTKHRVISYSLRGTSRFARLYGDEDLTSERYMVEGPAAPAVNILARARPAPPVVRYITPTLQFVASKSHHVRTSRKNTGFCLWLERAGRFFSGPGQKLAIVFVPPHVNINDALFRYQAVASFWGAAPIWDSALLREKLSPEDIVPQSESHIVNGLKLYDGNQSLDVSIRYFDIDKLEKGRAGHDQFVHYDAKRKAWWVDINLEPQVTAAPFVRFALCYYQPNAIPQCQLSSVVLANYVQLSPFRSATVMRSQNAKGVVTVSVSGPSYESGNVPGGSLEVRIVAAVERRGMLERHGATVSDELTWTLAKQNESDDVWVNLAFAERSLGQTTWRGDLALPRGIHASHCRILVREIISNATEHSRSAAELAAGDGLKPYFDHIPIPPEWDWT
jgi:hypothetical protein